MLRMLLASIAVLLSQGMLAHAADPMDWPYWRGPEQNGVSREVGLPDGWSPDGNNLLWSSTELAGKSSPIVMNGKLYTIVRHKPETAEEGEKIVCVDAATGKKIWENIWNVFLSDVPDTRIGWSSVVGDPETGRVYVQGVNGYFQCLEGDTGKVVWSKSLSEEFGLLTTYGGRTNFPVLFEDLVIVSGVMIGWGEYAKPNHRYLAFDKATGESIWFNETRPLPDDTTFSSPILGSFNGQLLFVTGSGDGFVHAFQPRTGKIVWKYPLSRRGVNGTPLIDGDRVFISQAEENPDDTTMGAVVALEGKASGELKPGDTLWRTKEVVAGRSNAPLLIDDRLYLIDDSAGLFIIDAKSGKVLAKQKLGTVQRSAPLYADGKIYVMEANGRWWILKPNPKSPKGIDIVHKLKLTGESQASPIVSHGRIYITTTDAMYCISKPDAKPAIKGEITKPMEGTVADKKPSHIQIVPVEMLVRPGETIQYKTRTYNSLGQLLGETKASYSIDANGKIDAEGRYQADTSARHQASIVTATVDNMTSVARVRIVPDLPWKFDFNDGVIPVTWVGARYRHVPRELDGEKVIAKITTIPKGTRSQAWMGHTDLHDYTIQADVRGAIQNGKRPDIGLTAQRYRLDLLGQSQELMINMWPPVPTRMGKTIPFEWKENAWYTMKLSVTNEAGKVVVRGKVWPRGSAEPEAWTIDAEDTSHNRVGSPGLYGFATNAELYLDNIEVYPNKK